MDKILYMKSEALIALLFHQATLQQQLIESQQKIIELHQRIDQMTPKSVDEKEVHWHLASGGIMSEEAAASDDLTVVRRFKDWNIEFAKKYIKPHVTQQVFSETLNQMTRGLTTHIAELETKAAMDKRFKTGGHVLKLDERDESDDIKSQLAAVR